MRMIWGENEVNVFLKSVWENFKSSRFCNSVRTFKLFQIRRFLYCISTRRNRIMITQAELGMGYYMKVFDFYFVILNIATLTAETVRLDEDFHKRF